MKWELTNKLSLYDGKNRIKFIIENLSRKLYNNRDR
jgi:hypothetical protein